jgi:hypothetical protein
VAATSESATIQLGFLTIVAEGPNFIGGYLVTNSWGRPIEFRLSTAVQPNRIQQFLYGDSLSPFICADLIGKTLVEKTAANAQLIITDQRDVMPLRWMLDCPMVLISPKADSSDQDRAEFTPLAGARWPLLYSAKHSEDESKINRILTTLGPGIDLQEPFTRIREAIGEARRMGVTNLNQVA